MGMGGFKAKLRVAAVLAVAICFGLTGLHNLLKPISNGCIMTYMYPTYIPVSAPSNFSSTKYGLFLYHEGWQHIDFNDHLKKLNGVPVLFIPGNGGSYKQVRSLAAECERAYQGGPLEHIFHQEATQNPGKGGLDDADMEDVSLPRQYMHKLDWFAVDLEGEHSAMDGHILEEHTEYVVHAIHRILDHYKEYHDIRIKEGAAVSTSLPKNVILVGHSMGGFVARAAIIHPNLRKSAVETVLTLSTPHQSPPLPLQPSLGWYYTWVNDEWRKGYKASTTLSGTYLSAPLLSNVVVISISGGYKDYQVRSKLESLDGIVPPTHGFMITSTSMKNVWLSMEHQVILWCNQLVVQAAHTILSLIDKDTGQPFPNVQQRVAIFMKMLHSGIPQNFNWLGESQLPSQSVKTSLQGEKGSRILEKLSCPGNVHWGDDAVERDLYIKTSTVTVLAMDGRRRWLDIEELGSNGSKHFVFVTNLAPCSGVRLHLWREIRNSNDGSVEVTSRMVPIPSGPAPKQFEPGSLTEQAPPSTVFWLNPSDMSGFAFLTISVAPSPTLSGRPPPATSMGIGQFFSPREWERVFSPWTLLQSTFSQERLILKEDHPLAINLLFSVSLGLMPVSVSLKTTGCGIKRSDFSLEDPDESHTTNLCKFRCFPPVALAWDSTSGLHVFPNLHSGTVTVDASPGLWTSSRGSEKTSVVLLVDPHCSYEIILSPHVPAAVSRFLLIYSSKIIGLAIAVVFFAHMRQAYAWELDRPIPSVLSAIESNLRIPLPVSVLALSPPLIALLISYLSSRLLPPIGSFLIISAVCYLIANGVIILLILISELGLYLAARVQVFIKRRSQSWEGNCFSLFHWFFNLASRFSALKQVVRIIRFNLLAITTLVAVVLVCFVHPAFGLFVLVLSHCACCHSALCSYLTASFSNGHGSKEESDNALLELMPKYSGEVSKSLPGDESSYHSPKFARSYGETQLEIFHHRHSLLILHILAALMFLPSMVAWMQRSGSGSGHRFPRILDCVLCMGVVLHGICDSKLDFNFFLFPFPGIPSLEIKLSYAYLMAGLYSYLSGLSLAPYKAIYAMAAIGVLSFAFQILHRRNRMNGVTFGRGGKRHFHRN